MGEIINKTKGKLKQVVGVLTDDRELQRAGERDQLKGKVEGVVKKVKDVVK